MELFKAFLCFVTIINFLCGVGAFITAIPFENKRPVPSYMITINSVIGISCLFSGFMLLIFLSYIG